MVDHHLGVRLDGWLTLLCIIFFLFYFFKKIPTPSRTSPQTTLKILGVCKKQ